MGGQKRGELDAPRVLIYCVIPFELATDLHEPLRRWYGKDRQVEVVVEQRVDDRRLSPDRRGRPVGPLARERRTIRNAAGRRVAERRATLLPVTGPALPRRLRRYADRLQFYERVEPAAQHLEDLDTARIVVRFQAGDREAFSELYMRYFDRVYAYMRVVFGDSHAAEDATQQVFVKALEALPDYERRPQHPFRGWLFTAVRNLAITETRKTARIDVVDPAELTRDRAAPSGDPSALDWVLDRELVMFIERLPLLQRQVLVLRYFLDLSDKQIAPILGIEPTHVRVLQARALAFLAKRLSAIGRGPARGAKRIGWRRGVREAPVLRERRFVLLAGSLPR